MKYIATGISEFDDVAGGGLVPGNTLLLSGPPGVGKTSLLLQIADAYAREGRKAHFASGEMTSEALLDYAKRLGIVNDNITFEGNPDGINVELLCDLVHAVGAKFLVVDSVHVAYMDEVKADVGSVTQLNEVTNYVTSFAGLQDVAVIMICHLNKDGTLHVTELAASRVDAFVRVDRLPRLDSKGDIEVDVNGWPVDSQVRAITVEERSRRQGQVGVTRHLEMTEAGMRKPSSKALRAAGVV